MNNRTVVTVSSANAELLVPIEVPLEVIKMLDRRLRDRLMRPVAWKRRTARAELRVSVKRLHGHMRIERHIALRAPRYRRRKARQSGPRRWGLPISTRNL